MMPVAQTLFTVLIICSAIFAGRHFEYISGNSGMVALLSGVAIVVSFAVIFSHIVARIIRKVIHIKTK